MVGGCPGPLADGPGKAQFKSRQVWAHLLERQVPECLIAGHWQGEGSLQWRAPVCPLGGRAEFEAAACKAQRAQSWCQSTSRLLQHIGSHVFK